MYKKEKEFKVPFFKSQRNKLAIELTVNARMNAEIANKTKSISEFIESYDRLLEDFRKLSKMDGKVSSIKGNLSSEYYRLYSEYNKHLRDALKRCCDSIIEGNRGIYKHDKGHTRNLILNYKNDIEKYKHKFDKETEEIARAQLNFLCHECGLLSLLSEEKRGIDGIISKYKEIGMIDDGLQGIDTMEGHDFERWCGALLEKNGFTDVEVTPGSGDQGVDVLATKDGVKYAIQCKCYAHDLGNTPIQEVEAGKVFYGCHVGVVMTNRYFTKGAKELAEKTGTLLWDRDYLMAHCKK